MAKLGVYLIPRRNLCATGIASGVLVAIFVTLLGFHTPKSHKNIQHATLSA